MSSTINEINTKFRSILRQRVGTQKNIERAKTILQKRINRTTFTDGELAFGLVVEAIDWAINNGENNFEIIRKPLNDKNIVKAIQIICNKANDAKSNGKKTKQNESSHDISQVVLCANQAIEYLCFSLWQKSLVKTSNEQKEKNVHPNLLDIIGLDEVKKIVQERVIKPSKNLDIYKKCGNKVGGRILLYGLPGTGKTLFNQAIANEIDGKFYSVDIHEINSKQFDEAIKIIKNLFEEARKQKAAVIFIDEFETFGVNKNIMLELLTQMKQESDNILLVIATTNRPWDIDSSLIKQEIFDYQVYAKLPNDECRKLMIDRHLEKVKITPLAKDLLVKNTDGFNGNDIKRICDYLIEIAINKKINEVENCYLDINDVNSSLEEIKSSVSKQDLLLMESFSNN